MFADIGGANLRLLHRVTEVFSPGVLSLLASAQVTRRVSMNCVFLKISFKADC